MNLSLKKNNIRILSQYFYPDVASTGQLLTELAIGLEEKGVNVNVLTAKPTYAGKLDAPKKEKYKSVNIRRLRAFRMNKNSKKGQIFNSISFFIRAFIYLLFSSSKSPLLIVSNPPFLPMMGYFIYKLRRIKYIILIHDVFPEKAIKLNYITEGSFLAKFWKYWDKKSLDNASSVIVISETMKNNLVGKFINYGLRNSEKVTVIHNWANEDFIKPINNDDNIFLKEHSLLDKFIVLYSGNLGASYELEIIINAAKKTLNDDIFYLFIGDGVKKQKLQKMTSDNSLNNVKFLPYQKKEMLPFSLTAASVSIVTYEKIMEGLLMPSKLYTTLASGRAVIAFCEDGSEVSNIVSSAGCGFSVDTSNVENFIEKVVFLKNNPEERCQMGKNARDYFEKTFTLKHSLSKYLELIKKVN